MNKWVALILIVQAIALAGAAAETGPMRGEDIQRLLDEAVRQKKVAPGLVAGVIDKAGTNVFASGVRAGEGSPAVDGDTVFEIGSITKVFTSLLLADMTRRGEVKLDDPVAKFLPASVKIPARNDRKITLVDLATHTSGLPRLPGNLSMLHTVLHADNPYANYTVENMYEFLSHYSLPRDIGAKYEYSNLGAGLLGHALALKGGTNYEALIEQRICRPLGMTNTSITLSPDQKARLAAAHNESGKPTSNWDLGTLAGAGALRSSVNDLLKFLAVNMGKSKSNLYPAMQMQFVPRHELGSPNAHIGLGWHMNKKAYGLVIWHNGGTGGYHSFMAFCPETGRGVVVLSNSAKDIDSLGGKILEGKAERKD